MLDKIILQLEAMISSGDDKLHREIVKVFAKIIPQVTESFRDGCTYFFKTVSEFRTVIVKNLMQWSKANTTNSNTDKQVKMMRALFPAWAALNSCITPAIVKREYIRPGTS